jgi:hypothetical protein
LDTVAIPEAKLIVEFLTLQKRSSQIEQWLKYVTDKGRIHGRVITNGAVTGRMTHCVPLSTKALTRDGWVAHSELKEGDEILGFNMETRKKEWTHVKAVHFAPLATVGSVGTETRRLRCTAEHKLVELVSPGRDYAKVRLTQADKLRKHSAILVNAPYDNDNVGGFMELPETKYQTNQMSAVTRLNKSELAAWLTGFLLADGYFRGGWSFAQAEGHLLDVAQTALYLHSDKRVSRASKSKLKGPNQRWGFSCRQTGIGWIRSKERMQWVAETEEPVWCPETELGTWVMMQEDGFISISGNSSPNMAQIPNAGAYLGHECRALFVVPEGRKLVGIDASALELCMLAHYMRDEDFTKSVSEGTKDLGTDVHTRNMRAAGLDTRDQAKTFIYAFLYGAGPGKLGSIVNGGYAEGQQLLSRFMSNLPKLAQLKSKVDRIASTGWLPGLDGRQMRIRSAHSALNTLLQGAGAVVMKKALVLFHNELTKAKLDAKMVANVHDEMQLECSEEDAERVGKMGVEAIKAAGEALGLRCPLDGEYKVGKSWKETH